MGLKNELSVSRRRDEFYVGPPLFPLKANGIEQNVSDNHLWSGDKLACLSRIPSIGCSHPIKPRYLVKFIS